jgi:hypothetical protein
MAMAADCDALNYPYIHVRNVEWLKRTLLIFPHVVRMLPYGDHSPFDDPDIQPFCQIGGRRGPLLRAANTAAPPVCDAQRALIENIRRDLNRDSVQFKRRFGQTASKDASQRSGESYQIHSRKLLYELTHFLEQEGLAWRPSEADADGPEYIEFHPRLGEAVMSTLAFACARNEGLQIVTEFPNLHGKVIGQTEESVYEACLNDLSPRSEDVGEDAVQFLVYRRCDPSKLTAERLAALSNEWEALGKFREALQTAATRVPKHIGDTNIREKYLNDVVNDVCRKWEADRANLSNFASAIFGEEAIAQPGKLLEKLAEKAFGPAAAGGTAGIIGGLTLGGLVGAAAGFAVGLVTYASTTWARLKQKEKESPFRYLTLLEESGVGFAVGH